MSFAGAFVAERLRGECGGEERDMGVGGVWRTEEMEVRAVVGGARLRR
ncbi:hypothetical protein [Streptomyces sp. NPDC048248]